MGKVIQGKLIGKGRKFAIVVSRFNEFITGKLLDGAKDTLERHGVEEENITIVWVPGSFEIPVVLKKVAASRKYDALICLGAIIKGDTPHNEYIAAEASKGISQIALETGIPVAFGILTTDDLQQAIERAGTKSGNKGKQAAESALEMSNLMEQLK